MSEQKNPVALDQVQEGSFLPEHGGYYAGLVNVKGVIKAIIVAPKAQGEYKGPWSASDKRIKGSACLVDGEKNTLDMIDANTALGKWVQALEIAGFKDWHIPSRDQLEIIYRSFKPGGCENFLQSGMNISSVTTHNMYSLCNPKQCDIEIFKKGGIESFDTCWYWSSTQCEGEFAWFQNFDNGLQSLTWKNNSDRARAIRTVSINDLII